MASKNKGGREIRKPKQTPKPHAKADEPAKFLPARGADKPKHK